MSQQIRMNASAIGGTIQTAYSGVVTVGTDGIITVDSRDAPALLIAGASYVNVVNRWQSFNVAPRAASAARLVASTSLANGTLSIANQPDVPRQAGLRIDPGTSAITAGNVAIKYVGNDGVVTTDNVSVVTAASTVLSVATSKGMMSLTSVIVTGLVGGASPLVQLNDTNALAPAVDPGFVDFTETAEQLDSAMLATLGTYSGTAGTITPATAPNGTHTFGVGYSYTMPAS